MAATNFRFLTKSAFKIALSCPHKLYYYGRPDEYENANANDEFLESLAEGGFQVGELAKIYCDVPDDCDLKNLMGHEESLQRFGNLFVRVDILKKDGNNIKLIEVKAKSWNPDTDKFISSRPKGAIASGIRPYVYDVAFQKYVVCQALKELYPNEDYSVKAFLMMADARQRIAQSKVQVVTPFDVDELCDTIIAGETTEQTTDKNPTCMGMRFVPFIHWAADFYCNGYRCSAPIELAGKCLKCEFHCIADSDKKDGKRECWLTQVTEDDYDHRPLIARL